MTECWGISSQSEALGLIPAPPSLSYVSTDPAVLIPQHHNKCNLPRVSAKWELTLPKHAGLPDLTATAAATVVTKKEEGKKFKMIIF